MSNLNTVVTGSTPSSVVDAKTRNELISVSVEHDKVASEVASLRLNYATALFDGIDSATLASLSKLSGTKLRSAYDLPKFKVVKFERDTLSTAYISSVCKLSKPSELSATDKKDSEAKRVHGAAIKAHRAEQQAAKNAAYQLWHHILKIAFSLVSNSKSLESIAVKEQKAVSDTLAKMNEATGKEYTKLKAIRDKHEDNIQLIKTNPVKAASKLIKAKPKTNAALNKEYIACLKDLHEQFGKLEKPTPALVHADKFVQQAIAIAK